MSAVKLASGYIELTVKASKAMKEVVAEVNGIEKAAKKAGEAIEDGISEGAKGAAESVKEELTDALEEAGEEAGQAAGEAIEEGISKGAKEAGKAIKDEITDATKKAGKEVSKTKIEPKIEPKVDTSRSRKEIIKDLGANILDAVRKGAEDSGITLGTVLTGAAEKYGPRLREILGDIKIGTTDGGDIAKLGGILDAVSIASAGLKQNDPAAVLTGISGALTTIGQTGAGDAFGKFATVVGQTKGTFDTVNASMKEVLGTLALIAPAAAAAAAPWAAIVAAGAAIGLGTANAITSKIDSDDAKWYRDHGLTPTITNKPRATPIPPMTPAQREGASSLILPPGYARGGVTAAGEIYGPGTGTSDSILGIDAAGIPTAMVSRGEGVIRKSAMDAGADKVVEALNAGWLPKFDEGGKVPDLSHLWTDDDETPAVSKIARLAQGNFNPGIRIDTSMTNLTEQQIAEGNSRDALRKIGGGLTQFDPRTWLNVLVPGTNLLDRLPHFDDGGVVPDQIRVPEANTGQAGTFNQWLQSQQGKAYQYGTLYDCSGFMSQVYNQLTGRQMPRFNTESDLAAYGFVRGSKPGTFQLGIHHGGGGPNSHMAGTLPDGRNVESGGSGVQIGAGAHGAFDPQFEDHWYLPGSEGLSGTGGLGRSLMLGMPGTGAGGAVAPGGATPAATPGRTEGYIPAGAGGGGQAGTSFASGLLNMGAEAINGLIDQAASAASTAVAAGIAGGTFGAGAVGGSQAGAAAAQAALGLGTNAAKRGVKYGFQMAGIGIDAAAEILMPFGVPRLFNTDPTQFMPQLPGMPAAVTTGEKATQGADPGGPVQPGQLPGQQPVGPSAAPAQPGGVTPKAPAPGGGVGPHWPGAQQPAAAPAAPAAPAPAAPAPSPTPLLPMDFLQDRQKNNLLLPGFAAGGTVGVYDSGGWLPPGGIAINKSKGLEPMPVFNEAQWGTLNSIANRDVGQFDPSSSGGNTYNYGPRIDNVTVRDVQEFEREMSSRGRIEMMRHGARP